MNRGVIVTSTENSEGKLDITLSAEQSWVDYINKLSQDEKKLLKFLFTNAKGPSIESTTLEKAEKANYSKESVFKLCRKLSRKGMMMSLRFCLHEFWYEISPGLALTIHSMPQFFDGSI